MSGIIEILAPAGAFESVKAAACTGASAVYVGARSFSARASAENFGAEELAEATDYCHERGMKLYLAVNTLIRDDEMRLALETVKTACECGVDALIVQDLGFAELVKRAAPQMPLHASTQTSVHTPQGARRLYAMGFKRVVLARELSRREIDEIVNSCPIETEVFVHGALCMCVSGQCLFSAMLGGRSGNRGRCAQPCRLPFFVEGGNGRALSLKDNSLLDYLVELENMGVTSAKIEGRMKRPEYVAAAVDACVSALEGKLDENKRASLESVFSRSGFTDGYYIGNIGKDMFGARTKDDVTAADSGLLSRLKGLYKDEKKRLPLKFKFMLKDGESARLDAESGSFSAFALGAVPEQAFKAPTDGDRIRAQLLKTGGTPFLPPDIECDIDDGLAFPVSAVNAMRRECIEKIKELYRRGSKKDFIEPKSSDYIVKPYRSDDKPKIRVRLANCDAPEEIKDCELLYVPLFSPAEKISGLLDSGFNLGVEIPRCIFGGERRVLDKLKKLYSLGVRHALVSNIGAIDLALDCGFIAHGSFALNVFNTRSLNVLEGIGLCDVELSQELTAEQMSRLGGNIKRGAVTVGAAPLMITRACPMKSGGRSCSDCDRHGYIKDRKNNLLELKCDGFATEILNPVLTYAHQIFEKSNYLDFYTLRFSTENREKIVELYKAVIENKHLSGNYTNGLYKRGVI